MLCGHFSSVWRIPACSQLDSCHICSACCQTDYSPPQCEYVLCVCLGLCECVCLDGEQMRHLVSPVLYFLRCTHIGSLSVGCYVCNQQTLNAFVVGIVHRFQLHDYWRPLWKGYTFVVNQLGHSNKFIWKVCLEKKSPFFHLANKISIWSLLGLQLELWLEQAGIYS